MIDTPQGHTEAMQTQNSRHQESMGCIAEKKFRITEASSWCHSRLRVATRVAACTNHYSIPKALKIINNVSAQRQHAATGP